MLTNKIIILFLFPHQIKNKKIKKKQINKKTKK